MPGLGFRVSGFGSSSIYNRVQASGCCSCRVVGLSSWDVALCARLGVPPCTLTRSFAAHLPQAKRPSFLLGSGVWAELGFGF